MIIHFAVILLAILLFILYLRLFRMRSVYEGYEESSSSDVEAGASQYYDWDANTTKKKKRCPKCNYVMIDTSSDQSESNPCKPAKSDKENCRRCDIFMHPDINKFVLKSSVPACKDMSGYMLKSEMQPQDQKRHHKGTGIPDDYISKDKCENYKKSSYSNIDDWMSSWMNGGKKKKNSKKTGPQAQSYGWGSGFSTQNPGYSLDGNVVKSSDNIGDDSITINPGKPKDTQQQAKDQADTQNEIAGWSESKLGNDSGTFLGLPD